MVRRLLPLPLAVAVVVLGALVVAGLVTVLVMTQLAEVAGSLTGYQANLHQKIQDIRGLSEGGGALSRFVSMVASLGRDLDVTAGPAARTGGARAERRLQFRERGRLRGAADASAADHRHRR